MELDRSSAPARLSETMTGGPLRSGDIPTRVAAGAAEGASPESFKDRAVIEPDISDRVAERLEAVI
jgi:hypothetical protein